MIEVTDKIAIDENQLSFDFVRSSGPGGQNVNKVATAVQMRYNPATADWIDEEILERLRRLAGKRFLQDGTILITAQRYRTQERNRQDAIDRLVTLLQKALEPQKPRLRKKPSKAAKERRLTEKRKHSQKKRQRSGVSEED